VLSLRPVTQAVDARERDLLGVRKLDRRMPTARRHRVVLQPDLCRRAEAVLAQVDPPDQSLDTVGEQHHTRVSRSEPFGPAGG
jgi:hypothetical protein